MSENLRSTTCGCGSPPPERTSGCCGGPSAADSDAAIVSGIFPGIAPPAADRIPTVATRLTLGDRWGAWKARWGINRMNYQVTPGLYRVGRPDKNAPVLVTANYKMSFDRLRSKLGGMDAWIMVLDTRGINVWCAAGKGTFGTAEIIERVRQTRLSQVVDHRTLILPQLGAPGVAAHEVKKSTGFKVIYGPVRAADIPAFLQAGMQATSRMRKVRFSALDRLVLTPMELVAVYKYFLGVLALLFALQLLRTPHAAFLTLLAETMRGAVPFLGAVIAGAVLTPLLLPWVPGRAFAWKGCLLGLLWSVAYVFWLSDGLNWTPALFYLLVLPAVSSYLAMNFTGASTYTSLSGVIKEMKTAVPAQIAAAGAGVLLIGITALIGLFT
jgi:hypothetical protein